MISNNDLKLAEISGIHSGDGYLRNDGLRREWDISGSIDEKDYYDNHVIPLFNEAFDLDIKGKFFPSRSTYGFVIRDIKTIRFAHEVLGFPYGAKSSTVKVPNFIFDHKSLIFKFLRGYFDTDGYIGCSKKYGNYCTFKKNYHCYPRASFSTVSKRLSDDLRKLLQKLNVHFCFNTHNSEKETENLKYIYMKLMVIRESLFL